MSRRRSDDSPSARRRRASGADAARRVDAAIGADATDDALTTSTTTLRKGQGDVLLLACGALAREVLAVLRANAWRGLDLQCLPALLHNRPELIPERVREAVRAARSAGYRDVKVLYADCGTGGALDVVCAEEGVERIPGPHCYSFFDGNDRFAARAASSDEDLRAFYLTDFLARQFDALVWRGMGLDRHPDLVPTYFGNYEKIVYLAQTNDPALDAAAEAAAERLGLAYERRFTGYGDLASALAAAAAPAGDAPR